MAPLGNSASDEQPQSFVGRPVAAAVDERWNILKGMRRKGSITTELFGGEFLEMRQPIGRVLVFHSFLIADANSVSVWSNDFGKGPFKPQGVEQCLIAMAAPPIDFPKLIVGKHLVLPNYADIRFAQDDDLDTLDERGLLRGPVRESLVPRGPLLLEDDRSEGGDGTLFVRWAAEEGVPHGGEVDNVFEGHGFEPLPPEVSAVFVSLEEDTCRYQKPGLSPVP